MMPRKLVVLMPLLLAGCGLFSSGKPPAPVVGETPAEAECRAQAANAPQLNDIYRTMNPNDINSEDRIRNELIAARQKARQDCLVGKGLRRGGGGVEPVRRPGGINSLF
ncbi:hypothetical protein IAI18_03110 [Acetobacteraceae bacterium H6797]|nr:hypothetical protein [Acetobacteraceae bacterium H6797]